MSYSKLYKIGFVIIVLLGFLTWYNQGEASSTTFTDCSTKTSVQETVACFHLNTNQHINLATKNLKLIFSKDTPVTQGQTIEILKAPPEAPQPGLLRDCQLEYGSRKIQNLSTVCLLTRLNNEFALLESALNKHISAETNPQRKQQAQDFVYDHSLRILNTLDATLAVYNQLYMAYPMHTHLELIAKDVSSQIDALQGVSSSFKKYNIKFPNASTTECQ